jgi:DNA-directed RNA polymerase subunit RPC12/RpoP
MSDRKYRHRGYQDDDHDRERQQRQKPKTDGVKRYDGAPRGRGVGTPTAVTFKCARCGTELKDTKITKDSTCTSCGSALYSCTNCTFFNTGARFECSKPIANRIESKTKANECTFFKPKAVRDLKAAQPEKTTDARSAFDALFKK